MKAAILGIPGPVLSPETEAVLRQTPPSGVILFRRNVVDPGQLSALLQSLRAVLPDDAVLMVDQEGGRVARLRPPYWRAHPAAGVIGALHESNPAAGLRAAWLTGALIGAECRKSGFDVVCAPVLDRRLDGYHDIIGDRGFSADPQAVAELGAAMAQGLLAAGIQPVIKHLPGHGRARVDSHFALPVDEECAPADLLPFIANAQLPWAMTAHLLYPAWDKAHPATLSAAIISNIIRKQIGFAGVLVSDDLAMQALSGPPEQRAVAALAAGCDVALYCAGEDEANGAVLAACPELSPHAVLRLARARRMAAEAAMVLNMDELASEREALMT